ncbi:MAG: hypothetical protein R3B06_16995 [Kofleriaceae bacterium]
MICIITLELMVTVAGDLTLTAPLVATVSVPDDVAFRSPVFAVILTVLPCIKTLPAADLMVMSPSDSMLTVFFATSRWTRFLFDPSMTETDSLPSVSSNTIRCPTLDLMTLTSFLPSGLVSGGGSPLFHTEPMTIGRSMSPCSNTTTTWSPTSGKKYVPRSGPAIGTAIRAKWVLSSPGSHGYFTFTRNGWLSSLLSVTMAM